ncbi:MAG: hypothetical protein LBL92_01630, partial [Propionibacteriaceae bacterium]|nr:hypothetical protein [Propionibacteriaceae bacterium]
MADSWSVPVAERALDASVVVPGSKSATARALVLSALADGPGTIDGGLVARDTDLMIAALRALGAGIDTTDAVSPPAATFSPSAVTLSTPAAAPDHNPAAANSGLSPDTPSVRDFDRPATGSPISPQGWRIQPIADPVGGQSIDCGLAGTVLRFVPPLAALATRPTRFYGDVAAAERPIAPLLDGLVQLGATVTGDRLPFTVTGPLTGRTATIDASGSSQFVSGLLLAAARFPDGLELHHAGPPIPSWPHIEMTLQALADRGVATGVTTDDDPANPSTATTAASWRIAPDPIQARNETIEPDLTTAAVFLAAALVAGGSVTVPGWPRHTSQPGAQTPAILTAFGGHFELTEAGLTVTGDGQLHGLEVDLRATSELTPVVAALAVLADSPTTIRGVAHIRGHETNR